LQGIGIALAVDPSIPHSDFFAKCRVARRDPSGAVGETPAVYSPVP
jgi:hypothetical protein